MERRSFLKNSGLAAAALGFQNTLELGAPAKKIGLQLYSVRDDMAKDAGGTIAALAKMGYRNIEGFGMQMEPGNIFKTPVAEFKKMMAGNGQSMRSSHINLDSTMFDAKGKPGDIFKKHLESSATLGLDYLIYPWIKPEERTTEFMKNACNWLNEGGALAKKQGITMGYHNHDFEFTQRTPDGRLLYEVLLQETDPALVAMQMDLYWVCFAGYQPMDWLKMYPNRFRLFHVKDMAATEKRETIEVGDGSINFQEIFDVARSKGVEHYVVELEHYRTTPMEGVGKAFKGVKKLKI